ncbi:hypothetical protein Q31a_36270 [Aureliella helgolandensis]|uniref:Uncharacterized protein n=1 Tax=Aureliella helgolandensis TaxID=2527968 RepID=A0A518G9Q7_9BACT|nr:hypothetical protein Q31a_36270 [Aureliella helgolandensis]
MHCRSQLLVSMPNPFLPRGFTRKYSSYGKSTKVYLSLLAFDSMGNDSPSTLARL